MKIQKELNEYANYLNGFKDVKEHKSVGKVLTGILKILSYALVIPYFYSKDRLKNCKKVVEMQSEYDNKILNVFQKTVPMQSVDQNELVNRLATKLKNFEPDPNNSDVDIDTKKDEKALFQKGFKLLDFKSQKDFFKQAAHQGFMEQALNWIPEDTKELNLTIGDWPSKQGYSGFLATPAQIKNSQLIIKLLSDTQKLKQLNVIDLDLKQIGMHEEILDDAIKFESNNSSISGREFHIKQTKSDVYLPLGIYQKEIYIKELVDVFKAIKMRLKEKPDLQWMVQLQEKYIGQADRNPERPSIMTNKNMGTTVKQYLYPEAK
jgi:hypothetical protein